MVVEDTSIPVPNPPAFVDVWQNEQVIVDPPSKFPE
jgi:hypothetical protein